jgi:hypothetical protein
MVVLAFFSSVYLQADMACGQLQELNVDERHHGLRDKAKEAGFSIPG